MLRNWTRNSVTRLYCFTFRILIKIRNWLPCNYEGNFYKLTFNRKLVGHEKGGEIFPLKFRERAYRRIFFWRKNLISFDIWLPSTLIRARARVKMKRKRFARDMQLAINYARMDRVSRDSKIPPPPPPPPVSTRRFLERERVDSRRARPCRRDCTAFYASDNNWAAREPRNVAPRAVGSGRMWARRKFRPRRTRERNCARGASRAEERPNGRFWGRFGSARTSKRGRRRRTDRRWKGERKRETPRGSFAAKVLSGPAWRHDGMMLCESIRVSSFFSVTSLANEICEIGLSVKLCHSRPGDSPVQPLQLTFREISHSRVLRLRPSTVRQLVRPFARVMYACIYKRESRCVYTKE